MPSSSASVATTASSSPSTRRRSISRRCDGRVAGAVGRDPLGQVGSPRVLEPQAGEALDQLHPAARLEEADRAHLPLDEIGEQRGGLGQRRRALARSLVNERRVPHRDLALGVRRAVAVDQLELEAGQALCEIAPGWRSWRW